MLGRNTAGNGKHALQHASLLGHMDRLGFLDPKYTFLEFGAGKGIININGRYFTSIFTHVDGAAEFSARIFEAQTGTPSFVLVDMGNFKNKVCLHLYPLK